MADTVITIKLTPNEYRNMRSSLETRAHDAKEHAREVQGEDPRLSRVLTVEANQLTDLLERI